MPLIDFIKMDYDKLQQYLYEQWDEDIDTKTSATGMRLLKVLSSVGFMNVVYLKKSFQNAIYSEATDRNIVVKKARTEKGYKCLPVVSAYVQINFSIPSIRSTTVIIPKWTKVTTQKLNPNFNFYTISDTSIPAGQTTTSVLAVEGSRIQLTFIASGINYEYFEIKRSDVTLREIEVSVNSTVWSKVDDIIDAVSTDSVWTYEPGNDGKISIMFGNNFYGKKLALNDNVDIWCLVSSGASGNIKSNSIVKVDSAIYDSGHITVTDITCNNPNKPYGGTDLESLHTVKSNSYNAYKSNWGLVTLRQYESAVVSQPGVDRVYCADINTSINVPFRQVWCYMVDSEGENVVDPYLMEVINYVDSHKVVGTEFSVKPVLYTNYTVNIDLWITTGSNPAAVVTEVTDLINATYSKAGMGISDNVEVALIGADLKSMVDVATYDILEPTADVSVPAGYIANAVSITVNIRGTI